MFCILEKFEAGLLKTIKGGDFEKIKKDVTPKALTKCESGSLLMAMKVFGDFAG